MNYPQVKGKFNLANLENTTTLYDVLIPRVSSMSPFSKVCFEVGLSSNLVLLAQISTQILENFTGWE